MALLVTGTKWRWDMVLRTKFGDESSQDGVECAAELVLKRAVEVA